MGYSKFYSIFSGSPGKVIGTLGNTNHNKINPHFQHLAERLEKRRHILEFRRLQEQQNKQEMLAEVQAFEEPIVNNLVKEGKLTEKQKDEILNEHEKNLQNLQKQQEIGK